MLVLALDTSSPATSCALVELLRDESISDRLLIRSRIMAEQLALPPLKAGELLPENLAALAFRGGDSIDDIGGLAVGLGPGSFTGLRVGLASAKGLAYARGWPLAGCSSLRALALGAVRKLGLDSGTVVAALEARKGELFLAAYSIDGRQGELLRLEGPDRQGAELQPELPGPRLRELGGERVLPAREVAGWLQQLEKPKLLGPGASRNLQLLKQHGVSIEVLDHAEQRFWPSAAAIAELCAGELFEAKFDAEKLFALSPVYLAQSEAEKALAEGRVGKLPGAA